MVDPTLVNYLFIVNFTLVNNSNLYLDRGKTGRIRQQMRNSVNFNDWKFNALKMDEYLNLNQWKLDDKYGVYYDSILVKKVLSSLKYNKQINDIQGLINVLEICVKNNFAGTESTRLYSETFYGSKSLIEDYINEGELIC